ncbi:CRAL-TRIO domain-containing protein [Xylaria bambusicola]|uniref:CRAL-TRIO domain-containing protein n=1 Tax=Xylaria bambusicola TaxID=326684 RepID=UPI002008D0ED|nr:CRAL-TRIO domain-containing protein [Xylaria bambusicola]KAI0506535.1 CRAL-TRIO domain-containing protein [Xylaria bambusicola]
MFSTASAAAPKKPEPTELELDPKYDHYDFPTTSIEEREGHPGFVTPTQQAQVHQLRMMLESENFKGKLDTLTLLRFLRARKFDVVAAKKMIQESQEWRQAMTIVEQEDKQLAGKPRLLSKANKDPLKNPPPQPLNIDEEVKIWDHDGKFKRVLSDYYTQFYHKTDKDGRPCYFEKLGGVDFAALEEKEYTSDKMILNLAVEYERMVDPRLPACSRKAGRLVETSCSVLDIAGVSILRPGKIYSYIRQTSAMSGNNYPERMGKMFVINANRWQKGAWTIVQSFLDPVTASKINVLTGPEAKTELPKHIPIENLPASFYGKCQCEGGCELSDAGPWQDPEFRRPAWWEKNDAATTIENKPTEIEKATADGEAPIVEDTKIESKPIESVEGAGAPTSSEAPVTEETKIPA